MKFCGRPLCKLTALLAIISPGAHGQSQQYVSRPSLGPQVTVAAATNTPVWTYNNSTRILDITLQYPPCILYSSDTSVNWYLAGNGYTFSPTTEPVPNQSLTITCTTAQVIYIVEGH